MNFKKWLRMTWPTFLWSTGVAHRVPDTMLNLQQQLNSHSTCFYFLMIHPRCLQAQRDQQLPLTRLTKGFYLQIKILSSICKCYSIQQCKSFLSHMVIWVIDNQLINQNWKNKKIKKNPRVITHPNNHTMKINKTHE